MQREIKFRAWDKKEKSMLYLLEPAYEKGKGAIIMYAPRPIEDGFELMQFTGLKDKNSKEIYEGDLLDLTGGKKYIVQINWDVEAASFYAEYIKTKERSTHLYAIIFAKIIGNILENLDLLKA